MKQEFSPEFELYVMRLLTDAESACFIPPAGWEEKRAAILRGMERTLCHDLPREWPDLAPRTEGVRRRDGFSVEQVSAEFWPGVRYALQVYVPEGAGPFPAVVMAGTGPHGPRHSLYQQLGGGLARLGILVAGVVALGKGARGTERCAYDYNCIALLAGTSIAQEQMHTGQRTVDYLYTRPDVDRARLGITGDSDGGWVTLWVATNDDRITAAAPAVTNYTFCTILGGQYPWQEMDAAEGNPPEALVHAANIPMMTACNAPKWFRFLNAYGERQRLHDIPNIDGLARAAYAHAGVPERYGSHLADCEHGYWPPLQLETIGWFHEVFFGERPAEGRVGLGDELAHGRFRGLVIDGRPVEVALEDTPAFDQTRVGDLHDDPGEEAFLRIIETRRADARRYRSERLGDQAALREELSRCLGLPENMPEPRLVAGEGRSRLQTEPGLTIAVDWTRSPDDTCDTVRLVIGAAEDRAAFAEDGPPRLDLEMREEAGLGKALWALVLTNRPPLGMWVWDAMCAAQWLRREGFARVELVGAGEAGAVIAPYTGFLSSHVDTVRLVGSPVVSLDELVGQHPRACRYWAHRLLWVADTTDLIAALQAQGRWLA